MLERSISNVFNRFEKPKRLGYSCNTVGSIKCGRQSNLSFIQTITFPAMQHGFLGETEVIVDLLSNGSVALADRKDAIRPGNAKRADVRKILNAAAKHYTELTALWEKIHGKA
jgi:hypothetical protein